MAPRHRLRMVEIADIPNVAKSAVTKTVVRLVDRGLLGGERDPTDRRTVYATLSPEGDEVFATVLPVFVRAVERHFTGQVTDETLRQLLDLPDTVLL